MNFEKWNEQHQNQTEKDVNNYLRLFDELLKIVVLYISLETLKKGLFSFGIYPVLNRKINVLFEQFHRKSVSKLDFYIDKHYRFSQKKFTGFFNEKTNQKWTSDFLKKDKRRLLSERVWKLNAQFRQEIEMALDVAIADGVSASQLATHLKQYLKNPDALFRRYRDKNGVLQLSKNALAYHTGRGVYRSAYKNAERLARTEINIAYRSADIERWQGLDFIAGYQIKRSRNLSPCPICDMMAGVYPKSFVWVGNHPNCRCYMVPIFKADIGNKSLIINPKLTQWLSKNADNIPKNKPMFLWGVGKKNLLTETQKQHRKGLQNFAIEKYSGKIVNNEIDVKITTKGIKEFLNQPHKYYFEKNELIKNLDRVIKQSKYLGKSPYHKENSEITYTHIFETKIKKEKSWLLARETKDGQVNFYSISDNSNVLKEIKAK